MIFAFGCAFSWTLANLSIRRASRRYGPLAAMAWALLGGIVLLGMLAVAMDGAPLLPTASESLILAGAGVSALLAYGGLFVAMGLGPVSVAAPIVSAWSVVALAIGLASGERLAMTAAAGVALVIVGNAVLAWPGRAARSEAVEHTKTHREAGAVVASIVAALGFGFLAPLTEAAVTSLGRFWPLPMVWGIAAAIGLPCLAATGRLGSPPRRLSDAACLALPAFFEGAGFVFFALALATTDVAIVGPVCSLATGMTVIAGVVWMRERLTRRAIVGAVAASLGVVFIQGAAS